MSYISWNCRGMHDSLTVQKLCEFNRIHKLSLLFLSETLYDAMFMSTLKSRIGLDDCFAISCNGRKGGVCLMWSNHLQVQIILANQSVIHAYITPQPPQQPCLFTGVYGSPQPQARWDF